LHINPTSGQPYDIECKVTLYFDSEFVDGADLIGVHPNDNTATVWIKATDLIDIIKQHGNKVIVVEI